MKLFHLSDLHLGKRVHDVSMLEDQAYILEEILRQIDLEQPDALLMAGDIYDKSVPPAEAVELLDKFLCQLAQKNLSVFISSGNHDSAERLAFGSRLMEGSGIHIQPVYDGQITPHSLGNVDIYMLPFLKPAHVRRFFPEEVIESYTDALRVAISHIQLTPGRIHILMTHQFVTGASRCDSEEISVGGTDNVDASVFEGFDYVALGHIHGPQDIVPGKIRYCGTPLKYSFSEISHQKSITVVEVTDSVTVRTLDLVPLRNMRQLRGSYEELTAKANYEGTPTQDYLHIILTDEEDVHEAAGRLRTVYPNLLQLTYDNTRTRSNQEITQAAQVQQQSPLELFEQLYELQNNQAMDPRQKAWAEELIQVIWEEDAT